MDRAPASRRLPQLGASILVSKSRISADRGREMGTGRYFRGVTYCDPVFASATSRIFADTASENRLA